MEALAGPVLARIPSVLGQAEVEVAHILEGGIAGMVHDDVEDYTDAALVSLGDEGTELVNGAHVRIKCSPVKAIVAVVCPVGEVASLAAAGPAVSLLVRSGNPECVDAEGLRLNGHGCPCKDG